MKTAVVAFERSVRNRRADDAKEHGITPSKETLAKQTEVVAELMKAHVQLKNGT